VRADESGPTRHHDSPSALHRERILPVTACPAAPPLRMVHRTPQDAAACDHRFGARSRPRAIGRPTEDAQAVSDLVVVIFSKDRPLQLDATIRSLRRNCDDIGSADIRVLYVTSTPAFAAGYRVLANEHQGVEFLRESDFKADLVRLVEGTSHVMFLVDDTLFVGPLSLARAIQTVDAVPACLGFSFRLGKNTTHCYTLDKPQRLPAFEGLGSGVLTFDWTDAEHDFGYPLELSSSLYRTADVLPLLRTLDYRNPNTLESALAQHADSFRETRPRLACYGQSVALSVPANLVQTAWKNRVDSNPALTAEALVDAYAHGQRLDVERYRGFVPNAAHQELDFHFKVRSDVPTVSVITRCYAQAQYLPDAVASVVAQAFDDWELIIVDDGSPDDTAQVAQDLIDRHPGRRIRLLRGPNRGLSGALNTGIEAALGRYILPLDADDEIAPTFLESTVRLLEERPDIAIAFGDQQRFGDESSYNRLPDFSAFMLPLSNTLSYCSLYRTEVWSAVGGYKPNMSVGYEDWDFWIGAVEHGYRAARAEGAVTWYRVHLGSMAQVAQERNRELRLQLRANHPRLYRPWNHGARAAVAGLDRLLGRIRMRIRVRTRLRTAIRQAKVVARRNR
jgi:glycosyltransferase involved in cell wall biosynthesis